jgi:hypothetical protein
MTVMISGPQVRGVLLGVKVDKASATLPASTVQTLFTITGGRILLTSIVGEVTTIIQAQANATKLVATPTVGTAVDLCATLDITGDEVGCLYGITGTFATAMVGANAGATPAQANGIIIPIGTIKLSCAATNTGATKWSMTYVALDDGASVA